VDTVGMEILGRVNRLSRIVGREIESLFQSFKLDRAEFDVLAALRRAGPPFRLTPTELYLSLMGSSGGMTHRINRLTAGGLVVRSGPTVDGRSSPVELTTKGRSLIEAAFRADMALEARYLRVLSTDERIRLATLLRALLRPLEAMSASTGKRDRAAGRH
jgi:DNA-binding MarR family transcriptional regulator